MATKFPAPLARNVIADVNNKTIFARPWIQWLQEVADKFNFLFADPPVITGSRGGNAAVASLLTQLAAQGYIVDKTTP